MHSSTAHSPQQHTWGEQEGPRSSSESKLTMGKEKDKKNDSIAEGEDKVSHEEKLKYVSVIAKPMASKKLSKKVKYNYQSN